MIKIAALFGLVLATNAHAFLIDDFNDPVFSQIFPPDGPTIVVHSDAMGGQREITVQSTGPLNASVAIINGTFFQSADAETSSFSETIWEDLAGVDFTDANMYNSFAFDIIAIDQGNVDISFTARANGVSQSITRTGLGLGINEVFFSEMPFIDFTAVDRFIMEVNAGKASDIAIDFISTQIPIPHTVTLIVVGLIGWVALSGRRRQ